jgi:hypothetical protein
MIRIGRRALVILFLILLLFQLSGLSCLDEWNVVPQKCTFSQETSTLDDDCPCHFTFVSSPSINVRWSSLITRVVTQLPTTHASDLRFLLFRPPALA